jgi:hypothetical protein
MPNAPEGRAKPLDHLIRNLGLVEEALSGLELVGFIEGKMTFLSFLR